MENDKLTYIFRTHLSSFHVGFDLVNTAICEEFGYADIKIIFTICSVCVCDWEKRRETAQGTINICIGPTMLVYTGVDLKQHSFLLTSQLMCSCWKKKKKESRICG